VKAVLESEGANFAPWHDESPEAGEFRETPSSAGRDDQARSLRAWGFRRVSGSRIEFLFNDAGWEHATEGFGRQEAAKALFEAGFLDRGDEKHWKKRQSRKGLKAWWWVVRGEILEADLGD
jgi:hypothetical protein